MKLLDYAPTPSAGPAAIAFYPTPSWLAAAIVERAQLRAGERVVEPTCGDGAILGQIPPDVAAFGVELDPALAAAARAATGREVIVGDVLDVALPPLDAAVGNPPFAQTFVEALLGRLHGALVDGGRIVAALGALVPDLGDGRPLCRAIRAGGRARTARRLRRPAAAAGFGDAAQGRRSAHRRDRVRAGNRGFARLSGAVSPGARAVADQRLGRAPASGRCARSASPPRSTRSCARSPGRGRPRRRTGARRFVRRCRRRSCGSRRRRIVPGVA